MLGALVSTGLSAVTGQPGASMGLPSMGSSASSSLKSSGGVHFYEGQKLTTPPPANRGFTPTGAGVLIAVIAASLFLLKR